MTKDTELLKNIKDNMSDLEDLLARINQNACAEDYIYRFYHQSFKVYGIQGLTKEIVDMLGIIAPPDCVIHTYFLEIFCEGTGSEFELSHNEKWLDKTRPMLEAFFHAKYFLEMAVKYGKELKEAPNCLPSGWAALLYYYGLR